MSVRAKYLSKVHCANLQAGVSTVVFEITLDGCLDFVLFDIFFMTSETCVQVNRIVVVNKI